MTHDDAAVAIDAAGLGRRLVETIRAYGRVAVAFSGGIDSTVVAKAAQIAVGPDALAVTGRSQSLATGELEAAANVARHIGIRHVIIDTDEFANPDYVRNDGSRCYYCKSELYDRLLGLKDSLAFDVICSGANLDDLGDYRPGLRAAAERGVRHPLQEARLNKEHVRQLARHWDLPNYDKPATPCLSSRLAIGVEATPERVERVDRAEAFLRDLGFSGLRVRNHDGEHARIELPVEQLGRLIESDVRRRVVEQFRRLGFQFVSLDLEGFRSGSLNVLVPADSLLD